MRIFESVTILAVILAACAPHEPTAGESIAYHAKKLCQLVDGSETPRLSCEVSVNTSSVNVHAHLSGDDASIACATIVDIAKRRGLTFASGWTFNIYSLSSGLTPIASCPLPS